MIGSVSEFTGGSKMMCLYCFVVLYVILGMYRIVSNLK